MTQDQENRMYDLFGKEEITEQEGTELSNLVDLLNQMFDEQIAEINID
jgi:hypothetical protein